jgi:RNA polymerase sigma-70 factor (ECF subfamily)
MPDPAAERQIRVTLDAGDAPAAATAAIRAYGPGILGYLRAVLRDESSAEEVFARFCEALWKGLPGFRGEASFSTWAHKLAWSAAQRYLDDPYRRRVVRLETPALHKVAAEVYSSTRPGASQLRRDRVASLRQRLSPDEQTLIILRVDRKLSWREIALVMADRDAPAAEAALRKRFERVKEKIKTLAAREGLLE